MSHSFRSLFVLLFIGSAAACAQVPRESVELSATVGRDVARLHRSHRELATVLYARIKADVNRFVDEVYAPYQIRRLLVAEQADHLEGSANSLFAVLESARRSDDASAQRNALAAMEIFTRVVRSDVEAYRADRLAPILQQEAELLAAIDRSYNQVHYANSIVTGHLASVVEVHDAQDAILREFGAEGVRERVGEHLASASATVAKLVEDGKRIEGDVAEAEKKVEELTAKLEKAIEDARAWKQE